MKQVVVVIPLYQEKLELTERISLRQAFSILKEYDIVFVAPKRLKNFIAQKGWQVEFFSDECFLNVSTYSKLLLTKEFYERFRNYEYLLIYQLDAFVFGDRLKEFCSLKYDYIGAPMLVWLWPGIRNRVGNGGLSLRRIKSCIRMIEKKEIIYEETEKKSFFESACDSFFGYCATRDELSFKVPKPSIAAQFSVEYDVGHAWKKIRDGELHPFGIHAWSKPQYFPFWRPYLMPFLKKGELDILTKDLDRGNTYGARNIPLLDINYLVPRAIQYHYDEVKRKVNKIFPKHSNIYLWGYGVIGRQVEKLFSILDIPISGILDVKARGNGYIREADISQLTKGLDFLVLCTTKYLQDMESRMNVYGFCKDQDFVSSSRICRLIGEVSTSKCELSKRIDLSTEKLMTEDFK